MGFITNPIYVLSILCLMVQPSSGKILVDGVDAWKNYREARSRLALVPQEIALDPFSTVYQTVRFARGYFGKRNNPEFFEKTLKDLSLWDKKDRKVLTLSGGMKRRMSIAKALMNEPKLLFSLLKEISRSFRQARIFQRS